MANTGTIGRPLGYDVAASPFPPSRRRQAEKDLFEFLIEQDQAARFCPENYRDGQWISNIRNAPYGKTDRAIAHLVNGANPTRAIGGAYGGPNNTEALLWPIANRAIFEVDGIDLSTALSGSLTVAALWKPKINVSATSILWATKGLAADVDGISWGGMFDTAGSYTLRHATKWQGSTHTGVSNVPGTDFTGGTGKTWIATIQVREGHESGNASLKTYYRKLNIGGTANEWAETTVQATSNGLANSKLMIGGTVSASDATQSQVGSASWDFAIEDMIILPAYGNVTDMTLPNLLKDLWFDVAFPIS